MDTKVCKRCGEEKPANRDHFSPNKCIKDGLHSYCKPCAATQGREWHKAHPKPKKPKRITHVRVSGDLAIVQLAKGMTALIDAEDAALVKACLWYASIKSHTTYAVTHTKIEGRNKFVGMHRLVMGMPDKSIDHINGNGLDNRKCNLRICAHIDNCRNQRKRNIPCTSRYKGVSLIPRVQRYCKSWRAEIRVDGKIKFLGLHSTELDAALAYDAAAREYFGEFARLNFPEAVATPVPLRRRRENEERSKRC